MHLAHGNIRGKVAGGRWQVFRNRWEWIAPSTEHHRRSLSFFTVKVVARRNRTASLITSLLIFASRSLFGLVRRLGIDGEERKKLANFLRRRLVTVLANFE